ncbi:MAG TPA: NAD(P)H-hydrate dehydratase [Myxococcota bacterium]|nr:NAD(P)H-hydrate dehydratase [Myxococcota bacterium]
MDYLVSGREMAELDARTIRDIGVPGRTLMEVAGRAVAEVCVESLHPGDRVVVACGPGNNGGDGFVVARALAARGFPCEVFLVADRGRVRGDAAACLDALEKVGGVPVREATAPPGIAALDGAVGGAALVVDALLGTGVQRDVEGPLAEAVAALNAHPTPVVSVDLPSGVNADTGAVQGCAVQATRTVTFNFAKRGHYLHPGAARRGVLTVADIGIPLRLADPGAIAGRLLRPHHGPTLLPRRDNASHKGTFGHVLVVAGSEATPGAAILAQLGALRSGAGLVSWAADTATVRSAPSRPPEVMLRQHGDEEANGTAAGRLLAGVTAAVMGPGLGQRPAALALLTALLDAATIPCCLDADALNLLAATPALWSRVRPSTVLTPHPKEMSRLTGHSVEALQRDRMGAAAALASTRRCVVVLKGAGTVVAAPDGTATVLGDAGSPALAHGGTGDVLAGLIGGLLAQGLETATAARLGVLLHAQAGDVAAERHGQAGTSASDVAEAVGAVLARWQR